MRRKILKQETRDEIQTENTEIETDILNDILLKYDGEPENKPDTDIGYKFKKIPWQLPKAPLDFHPPLDVPRIEAEKLSVPSLAGAQI